VVAEFSDRMAAHVAKRLEATGRVGADPLLMHPIALRRIGNAKEAHPKDEKLDKK
jgi:hypothetical protein